MLLEEYDRKDAFKKVLYVIRSVKTKQQYNSAIQFANNYIKTYKTNSENEDWKTINKLLTFIKIKVKFK